MDRLNLHEYWLTVKWLPTLWHTFNKRENNLNLSFFFIFHFNWTTTESETFLNVVCLLAYHPEAKWILHIYFKWTIILHLLSCKLTVFKTYSLLAYKTRDDILMLKIMVGKEAANKENQYGFLHLYLYFSQLPRLSINIHNFIKKTRKWLYVQNYLLFFYFFLQKL